VDRRIQEAFSDNLDPNVADRKQKMKASPDPGMEEAFSENLDAEVAAGKMEASPDPGMEEAFSENLDAEADRRKSGVVRRHRAQ
jgi:hypothetical protein